MLIRPILRYAALYAAVELAAAALLIWAIGLGWTMVVLAVAFLVGLVLAASQVKGQVGAIRKARANPQGAVADGVLVGLGTFLVFLPGLVTTAAVRPVRVRATACSILASTAAPLAGSMVRT